LAFNSEQKVFFALDQHYFDAVFALDVEYGSGGHFAQQLLLIQHDNIAAFHEAHDIVICDCNEP
jgi:hypothetical protein